MRHQKAGVKLGRSSSHREAMFRNMVTSLLKYHRIKTTTVKAKELRRWVDHVVTLAKRGDLHARRQAMAIVREQSVIHKLFAEAPTRFGSISGGYTRVLKIGNRAGDAAPMSIVELVSFEEDLTKKKPQKEKTKVVSKAAAAEGSAEAKKVEASPESSTEKPPEAKEPVLENNAEEK